MHELSFRQFILPLKDKLYRLALRFTKSRPEAEDVVQETMIRVWNRREEWQQLDSLEAYCTTVARHLAQDLSEKKDACAVPLTADVDCASTSLGPHEHLVSKETIELLRKLVGELPPRQQVILHLREIEGKSYKDIASALELTEEQVKVNLFRARQKVRQRFENIDRSLAAGK